MSKKNNPKYDHHHIYALGYEAATINLQISLSGDEVVGSVLSSRKGARESLENKCKNKPYIISIRRDGDNSPILVRKTALDVYNWVREDYVEALKDQKTALKANISKAIEAKRLALTELERRKHVLEAELATQESEFQEVKNTTLRKLTNEINSFKQGKPLANVNLNQSNEDSESSSSKRSFSEVEVEPVKRQKADTSTHLLRRRNPLSQWPDPFEEFAEQYDALLVQEPMSSERIKEPRKRNNDRSTFSFKKSADDSDYPGSSESSMESDSEDCKKTPQERRFDDLFVGFDERVHRKFAKILSEVPRKREVAHGLLFANDGIKLMMENFIQPASVFGNRDRKPTEFAKTVQKMGTAILTLSPKKMFSVSSLDEFNGVCAACNAPKTLSVSVTKRRQARDSEDVKEFWCIGKDCYSRFRAITKWYTLLNDMCTTIADGEMNAIEVDTYYSDAKWVIFYMTEINRQIKENYKNKKFGVPVVMEEPRLHHPQEDSSSYST